MTTKEYLREVTFGQALMEARKEVYNKIIHPSSGRSGQYPNHSLHEDDFSLAQEIIKRFILQEEPCMLARFGAVELNAFSNWMQVNKRLTGAFSYSNKKYIRNECPASWYTLRTMHGMEYHTGFFPATKEMLQKWGELVEKDIMNVDLLFTWQENEKHLCEYLNGIPRVFCPEMYNPYRFTNPWTAALKDKKVLVVSPFTETIERQYVDNREKIFPDTDVLPQFDLKTVKAYNTIGGNNPYKDINSWFDALEIMKDKMDQLDYDIALLGCGSYAFDLAAHAKRKGKKAITVCGALQVLFGIYGERYENEFKQLGLLNEYWVRPSQNERPEGYKLVENGAYW